MYGWLNTTAAKTDGAQPTLSRRHKSNSISQPQQVLAFKKQLFLRIVHLCTLACGLSAQPAQAQFLKKLGKAIEKIDKATSSY